MRLDAIVSRTSGDTPVGILALYGEVTSETVREMEQTIDFFLRDFSRVVIDFSHTLFVSSAGWRTLIVRCSDDRQPIRIAGMRGAVRDAYHLLGLTHVLPAYDTVDDALTAFSADEPSKQDPA